MASDEVPWLNENEARAWRGLQFMEMQLTAALSRQLAEESGLSYPDYVVLVALTAQPDGRLRVYELSRDLGWEKSRVSHHVARMAERGLVEKERCGDDRRGSFVVVTPTGRAEIAAAAPGHVRAVRELFVDRLTPAQLEVLGDVAETVLAAISPPG